MTNEQLLSQYYSAIKEGDPSKIEACITPDFVLHWQGNNQIPWAGQWQGVQGLKTFFAHLNQHIDVLSVERLHQFDGDGVTIIILNGHWRHKQSGKEISAIAANLFEFKEGRISTYTVMNNSAAFADTLR